jgi:hypothetical protein
VRAGRRDPDGRPGHGAGRLAVSQSGCKARRHHGRLPASFQCLMSCRGRSAARPMPADNLERSRQNNYDHRDRRAGPLRGCGVGKTSIVVFDSRTSQTRTIANRPDDLARFAATLDDTCLAICEATGGHEDGLLRALLKVGRAAHRADARKVKAFIRSFGTLGKTDAIDARALATYGSERHATLARWQAPDPQRERLQTVVLTRRDLIVDWQAYRNRLSAPGAAAVKRQLGKLLASFDQQVADITREIAGLIRAHKGLADAERAIRGIDGIGETTAAALLAVLPELDGFVHFDFVKRRWRGGISGRPRPRPSCLSRKLPPKAILTPDATVALSQRSTVSSASLPLAPARRAGRCPCAQRRAPANPGF